MRRIVEIGPFAPHIDSSQWGENYSERRYIGRMQAEMSGRGIVFSFEKHLKFVRKRFPEAEALEILDGGCGEGAALWDLKQIAAKLGITIRTTGITMDREHKKSMNSHVDEIVIGTVQNFFQQEDHSGQYHFILDYNGALAADDNPDTNKQGKIIIPIYARILAPRGTALLTASNLDLDLLRGNGLRIFWTQEGYTLVTRDI